MDIPIAVGDVVDPMVTAMIGKGLSAHNLEATGYSDSLPLAVLAHDPATGAVLGGAIGRTSLGVMFLNYFHLPREVRGNGLGTRILLAFEDEGRRRGCTSGFLYTISFQAPAFYERNGWSRFGEIPCEPPGASRIFLRKSL